MTFLIWLVIGGVIGWLASYLMRIDGQEVIFNITVGIVGAFIGSWLLSPMFRHGVIDINEFSITSMLTSALGSVILLGIVDVIRRGDVQ